MVKLGLCTGVKNIELAAKSGFEYIEISFADLCAMGEEDYQNALSAARAASIGVEAANCMLPGTVKVTGPEVDEGAIREYLEKAFRRGHEIGIKVVVFGSGAARKVPEGFPHAEAWRQIARYLTIANEYAAKYDIDIAIEPLRRGECNIMNLVTEATLMSSVLRLERVAALGDTYHMDCGHEPLSALVQAGELLKHVHISHSLGDEGGRNFPKPGDDGDYRAVFQALEEANYQHRVSIEASCDDLAIDAPVAFKVLDEARRGK